MSLQRMVAAAATTAFVFTWPPAFVVFAVATIVAPSVTDEASVGLTAFWALLFAILIAITAVVQVLTRRRTATPEAADEDVSPRRIPLRMAINALVTGACAWLVLATQGLSTSQIAVLAVVLVVVVHLLPMIVARLLGRLSRRRRASSSDPDAVTTRT
ncbi:hypothetical protein [Plantactinospora mayteni]|uniref:hypothetical protein n=1 Tax=Plantactinospora mayteni TaxID=566021 RepID=UPI0019410E3A|nr:hypothetical protein [Plantactinospora mayteni]